ncbi:hypothetical protein, partial [Pseudomonas sp. 2995-1]|uniref:hypothetical protein n=1 Tax=Pseudomonas sp. 2995-1 TaxID=1712679 RepID=UPI001C451B0B
LQEGNFDLYDYAFKLYSSVTSPYSINKKSGIQGVNQLSYLSEAYEKAQQSDGSISLLMKTIKFGNDLYKDFLTDVGKEKKHIRNLWEA